MCDFKEVKVLHVEDDVAFGHIVLERLERFKNVKFHVDLTPTLQNAEQLLREKSYDVILLDINLPNSRGADTLIRALAFANRVAIIVISGVINDEDTVINFVKFGAQDVYFKHKLNIDELPLRILVGLTRYTMVHSVKPLEELRQRITAKSQLAWKQTVHNSMASLRSISG